MKTQTSSTEQVLTRAQEWFNKLAASGRVHEDVSDYGSDPAALTRARSFQREYYDAGLVGSTVPVEYGGLGLDRAQALALAELADHAALPDRRLFVIGQGMVVPTLLGHGTEQQKIRYIPPILKGTEVWCQLFSEPGAGSDLASVSTRARRNDQGRWVLNGQKVWTSHGRAAEFGILLAKTESDEPKHHSLTMFVANMKAPGVDIRPLRQITGEAEFNEVFLEDVVLDDAAIIGQVGNGWRVAITTLTSERQSLSIGSKTVEVPDAASLFRVAGEGGVDRLPLQMELVDYYVRSQAFEAFADDLQSRIRAGEDIRSMGSVAKLESGYLTKKGADLAAQVAEEVGSESDRAEALDLLLRSRNVSIAGGTDNIQRNIIAERILGLPKEPRAR